MTFYLRLCIGGFLLFLFNAPCYSFNEYFDDTPRSPDMCRLFFKLEHPDMLPLDTAMAISTSQEADPEDIPALKQSFSKVLRLATSDPDEVSIDVVEVYMRALVAIGYKKFVLAEISAIIKAPGSIQFEQDLPFTCRSMEQREQIEQAQGAAYLAAILLVKSKGPIAIPVLRKVFKDYPELFQEFQTDSSIIRRIFEEIAELKDESFVSIILQNFNEIYFIYKGMAINVLGAIGNTDAARALLAFGYKKLTEEKSTFFLGSIVRALASLTRRNVPFAKNALVRYIVTIALYAPEELYSSIKGAWLRLDDAQKVEIIEQGLNVPRILIENPYLFYEHREGIIDTILEILNNRV